MQIHEILRAVKIHWWYPIVGLMVGLGAALGAAQLQSPSYTSETQLFVSTTDSSTTSAVFQGSEFSQQRVTSYADLLTGQEVATRVVRRLGLAVEPRELADSIRADPVAETVLINVRVTRGSPAEARDVATAVGVEFASFVTELERTGADGLSPVKVSTTEAATTPSSPSAPKTTLYILAGLVLGALGGVAIATLRSRLDRSVKLPQEIEEVAGTPVIGIILKDARVEQEHLIDRTGSNPVAESFRQLRTNLQFLNVDEPPKVIMISSAVPSEGKTTVAVNLAILLAEAGRAVTLVEADLRRPRVTRYLGMVGGVGLTNVLSGGAEVEDVLQRYGDGGLQVIAAGPTPPNPSELLASSHMMKMLDSLRDANNFVLIDAPPLLPVADASGLAVMVDGVVLSVRYGATDRDQLQQARATLDRVGARALGVVLNIVPAKAEISSAYGYGASYGYESDEKAS